MIKSLDSCLRKAFRTLTVAGLFVGILGMNGMVKETSKINQESSKVEQSHILRKCEEYNRTYMFPSATMIAVGILGVSNYSRHQNRKRNYENN